MNIKEKLLTKREDILAIAKKHGVTSIRLFGSVARGDSNEKSDIDLLIDVADPTPPWFPGGLVAELEKLTGRSVSVVEEVSLEKTLKEKVLAEAVSF